MATAAKSNISARKLSEKVFFSKGTNVGQIGNSTLLTVAVLLVLKVPF